MALTLEQIYGLRVRSGMDAFRPMEEHWQGKDDYATYRFARTIEAEVRKQDDALILQLVEYIEQNTCQHEETHRGGAIWEICDGCNAQWADDRGGKPKFAWAPIVLAARARLGGKP